MPMVDAMVALLLFDLWRKESKCNNVQQGASCDIF
jgi:hypothetical protein